RPMTTSGMAAGGHRKPRSRIYADRRGISFCLAGDQPVRSPAFRRSSGAPCDLDVAAHVPTIIQPQTPSCQSLVDIREEPVAAAPRRAAATAVIRLVPVIMLTQQGVDLSPQRRRSEEHTSELQSRENLVCRLLLDN